MASTPNAIVLCGGAGLRLRSVIGDAPKSMADVAGRPFLELLFRQLRRHGFERAILAVGYQKDTIRSYFGERACGLNLIYSPESSPLGTGGALRNAVNLVESDSVVIMNGDSYTDARLSDFVASHREAKADVSVIVVPADGRADCGSVLVDADGNIAGFAEKQGPLNAPYLNAGIYLVLRQMLYDIPVGVEVSLERELLPQWLRQAKSIKGFIHVGRCFDIGTPERYWDAQQLLADAELKASVPRSEAQL
jgi:D-glycero-alpha-D-manno-heptose 1-phosphate guanylyltransferase